MSGVHYAKLYDLMQNVEFKKAVVAEDERKRKVVVFY